MRYTGSRPHFGGFLFEYRLGTIEQDAAWRNYTIKEAILPSHIKAALKELNLAHAGEHGVSEAMRRYDIKDHHEAETILGSWWVWSELSMGHRVRGAVLKAQQHPALLQCRQDES
jgi:hypothetical protein